MSPLCQSGMPQQPSYANTTSTLLRPMTSKAVGADLGLIVVHVTGGEKRDLRCRLALRRFPLAFELCGEGLRGERRQFLVFVNADNAMHELAVEGVHCPGSPTAPSRFPTFPPSRGCRAACRPVESPSS